MKPLMWGFLIGALLTPIVASAQAEEVVYYHTDAAGHVRAITDANGAVIARYDFLPFGESWNPPSNPDSRQYASKERDAETELDYFGARYFRAPSGRFITVDPALNVEAALIDPQRWNRYSYAANNPLKFTDPDGRDPRLIGGVIGAAVYGGWQAYWNVQQGRSWYDNIGVEASKGFLVGVTLGLAAPVVASADLATTLTSSATLATASAELGAAREIAVARLVGGRLAGEPGIGMSVTVKGLGTTGVDVLGAAGEYIGVGGAAKGLNPADFGRKLQILKAAAEQAGVTAQYAFQSGTPRWVIDFAKKRLGEHNVFEFELR